MNAGDQGEIVAFLSAPDAFGPGTGAAERVETHISIVFLAGDRAYKLKRQVRYPYVDFSTLALRRAACEAEVRLNRRTAPDLYLGIVAVKRRAGGGLGLEGAGEPVEWLVEMVRFDENTRFDRLAARDAIGRHMAEDLADAIARFHAEAEIRDTDVAAGLATTIDGNRESMEQCAGGAFAPDDVRRLSELCHEALDRARPLLARRRRAGRVRRCHGDLHLRNICLVADRPTLFDAIEFNDTFADIDVIYDLAFLVMDLDRSGRRRIANIVMNRYMDASGDDDGIALFDLFLSLRAAIRAHVQATAATQISDPDVARRRRTEAAAYLEAAFAYLRPTAPMLIAVGGLSGSGKSRLGRASASFVGSAPGARVLRTDVIRKQIAGVGLEDKLGAEGYTAAMNRRTYDDLYARARAVLGAGRTVVADAVFAKPEERAAIAAVAADAGVRFQGFWLEAPADVMERRVAERKRNVSDATVDVVRKQAHYDLGTIDWVRIDSSGPKAATLAQALAVLGIDSTVA